MPGARIHPSSDLHLPLPVTSGSPVVQDHTGSLLPVPAGKTLSSSSVRATKSFSPLPVLVAKSFSSSVTTAKTLTPIPVAPVNSTSQLSVLPANMMSPLPVPPSKAGSPLPVRAHEEPVSMTSSIVDVLFEGQRSREKNQSPAPPTTAHYTKTQRLQVRLDQLQSDVNHLEQRSEKLEEKLKTFLKQQQDIAEATDHLDVKLDALAKSHKSVSSHAVGR
ncbi:uncharacterized protein LOC121867146 [Homarus americanus]|uniref:uncharacterized protein LOC121867146 n=1 Tax=Homarus americanus TaxID=6706 RepID=UPI001C46DB33|nr:uncharacterized protein LOC121867146 [Homarus americanus]